MFETCYLHIGLEKTGTTSIQRFLHINRTELAAKGFIHPQSLDAPNNTYLYVYGADEERINEAHRVVRGGLSAQQFRSKVAAELGRELTGLSGKLVLSNEHLHSELRSLDAVKRVHDLLRPFSNAIKVVAYLRRQDRVAISQYSTALKVGLASLPEVFKSMPNGIDYYYDYDSVLSNYATVFGSENIIARVFEKNSLVGGDAVLDFADAIGLKEFSWLQRPQVTNESLRPIALRFLAEVNKRIPILVNNTANPLRLRLISAIEQHFAGSGPMEPRSKARVFFNQFSETNERVRQKYFAERATLFSEDFSMYPESLVEDDFKFEDAARLAAILLTSLR